jgi:hypothetical protein
MTSLEAIAIRRTDEQIEYARHAKDEAPCRKCGAFTRGKDGLCRACKNGYGLPDPETLRTEQIVTYLTRLKAELKRRQDEIAAALKEGT